MNKAFNAQLKYGQPWAACARRGRNAACPKETHNSFRKTVLRGLAIQLFLLQHTETRWKILADIEAEFKDFCGLILAQEPTNHQDPKASLRTSSFLFPLAFPLLSCLWPISEGLVYSLHLGGWPPSPTLLSRSQKSFSAWQALPLVRGSPSHLMSQQSHPRASCPWSGTYS